MMLNHYDHVLYPGHPLAQAHPDRLATIATLFGMTPPDVSRCRVLELGCGDGTNLVSVALGLPESECIGIDLGAAGIARGWNMVQELGLKNVTLRHVDILQAGPELDEFDFIVAHGIYSWVSEPVRDKILAICEEKLAANGVAYISYNAYPGAHLRDMVREMMRYHVSEFTDAQQRVDQARALVQFLAEEARSDSAVYRTILQTELERIVNFRDSSLYHDDLADHSAPVYFYEFAAHAKKHHLQYLSEAHFFEIQAGIFPPHVADVLNRISDSRTAKEQYLDFLKCRRFRQTLLCHEERQLDDTPRPQTTERFHIASPIHPQGPEADPRSSHATRFVGPKNSSVETDNPLIRAALIELGIAWPRAIGFCDLLTAAQRAINENPKPDTYQAADRQRLADVLLRAYAGGLVEFHVRPPHFALRPGIYPIASPLARLQSRMGPEVTTLRHCSIVLDDVVGRHLLQLLDGTRDRRALVDTLARIVESGAAPWPGEVTSNDGDELREYFAAHLEHKLKVFADLALLKA